MDRKELSKHKYIYQIYRSSDGLIHIEKHPVIYANKEYVYFKTVRCSKLSYTIYSKIYDNFDDVNLKYFSNYHVADVYVWNCEVVNTCSYSKLISDIEMDRLKKKITMAEQEVADAKRKYTRALENLEQRKRELGNVNI